jgi:hypothetical protein
MPDDPMKPFPLEIFMRDYYEPRLFPRILNGKRFNARSVADLNRVQPEVQIISIESQSNDPALVTVKLKMARAKGEYGIGERKVRRSGAGLAIRCLRRAPVSGRADGGQFDDGDGSGDLRQSGERHESDGKF